MELGLDSKRNLLMLNEYTIKAIEQSFSGSGAWDDAANQSLEKFASSTKSMRDSTITFQSFVSETLPLKFIQDLFVYFGGCEVHAFL